MDNSQMAPVRRLLFFSLQVLFLLLLPACCLAAAADQSIPWEITADRIIHQRKPASIIAEGAVVIKQQGPLSPESMIIEADFVQYDTELETVNARGHLKISMGNDTLRAEEGLVDLNRQTGIFHNAVLFKANNNLYLTGAIIQKTGQTIYRIEDGMLTACDGAAGEALPWSIHSAATQIRQGDYARLKHTTFHIKNIPVFYFPFLLLPAGTERKSGMLFPEYSQSELDGTGLLLPVFLDLAPNSDITLYPGYRTRRGPVAGAEYRYVADAESFGTLAISYLNDKTVDTPAADYKSDGFLRTERQRYWFRGKANQSFENGMIYRMDLDMVSDQDFLQESNQGMTGFKQNNRDFLKNFQRGFQSETIPFRENTLQATKHWTTMTASGELLAVDDTTIVAPSEPTALMALPRLKFAGNTPIARTDVDLSWNTEYIFYWRERGLGAHRLDLQPRFIGSFPSNPYLDGAVALGLRETLYHTDIHDTFSADGMDDSTSSTRTMYDFSIRTSLPLVRDYALSNEQEEQRSFNGKSLRHMIRPELEYTYVPFIQQSDLPQLDATDRLPAENWLRYSLSNYFKIVHEKEDALSFRRSAFFKVYQSYKWQDDPDHPFSDLAVELDLKPVRNLRIKYETSISMYGQDVTHHDLKARYADGRGHGFSMDYRYLKHEDIAFPYFFTESAGGAVHELNVTVETKLTERVSAKMDLARSIATGRIVNAALHILYHPQCWNLEVIATKEPDDLSLMAVFSLDGLGKVMAMGMSGL
jgi:LPS-assembly protein